MCSSEPTSPIWRVLIGECDPLLLIWFAGHFLLLLKIPQSPVQLREMSCNCLYILKIWRFFIYELPAVW